MTTHPSDSAGAGRAELDAQFAELLAAWDESRRAGDTSRVQAMPALAPLGTRLERAKACLALLDQLWSAGADVACGAPGRSRRALPSFGRYVIERELGAGGHGYVYLAMDGGLKRRVALKIPRPEVLASEELRRRFLREAEANAKLDHPQILPIYEVGRDGAVCYIASAYCDGGTLAQWLSRRGRGVSPGQAADIVARLARGVHHAHTRGILHRDLKPANILLMSRDGDSQSGEAPPASAPATDRAPPPDEDFLLDHWVPKIADFGLAKVLDDDHNSTLDGVVMGTADYMSPEQAAGRKDDIGTQTDVYALSVILYELLTGAPPFRSSSYLTTLQRINNEEASWPGDLRSLLPRDLVTICQKCLEKRPLARYSSAAALAEDLECFLRGEPIQARPLRLLERVLRWVRRRPDFAMLATLAAALLIGFLVQLVIHDRQLAVINADLSRAIEHERKAAAEAQRAQLEAQRQAEENRRHSYADKLRLIQQFAEAGDARQTTMAFLESFPLPGADEDLRGFAWRYWWNRWRNGELFVLPGHANTVNDAVHSPSGRWIGTASSDGTVRVWDSQTGRELARLGGFKDVAQVVAFSGDESLLAAGDSRGTVQVFNTHDWSRRHVLAGHQTEIRGLCFADGATLISGGEDGVLQRWDALSGRELGDLTLSRRRLLALAAAWRKNLLLVGTTAGEVQFRDLESFRLISNRKLHSSPVATIAVSHQEDRAVSTDKDGGIRLWDLVTRESSLILPSPEYIGTPLAFSPAGDLLAAATRDGKARLIDPRTGEVKQQRQLDAGRVLAVGFSLDGKSVLLGCEGGMVAYWQPFQQAPPAIEGHAKEAWSVDFDPRGRWLASGSDDNTIRLWELPTGRLLKTLEGSSGCIASVKFSPDGSLLAGAIIEDEETKPDRVHVWCMPEGERKYALRGHVKPAYSLAFHPREAVLASGGFEVILWDLASGTLRQTLPESLRVGRKVKSISFSHDGTLLAHACEDGAAYVYEYPSLKLRHRLFSGGEVWSVAFSTDDKLLASGNRDGVVTVWDVATGRLHHFQKGHLGGVRCVAYTHGGKTVATCGEDKSIRLWDAVTGNALCTFKEHAAEVFGVAFSADDQWLASCSLDGAVKLWHAPPSLPGLGK
jgi:WD40 repeat protein/serine/threonine protein kinase